MKFRITALAFAACALVPGKATAQTSADSAWAAGDHALAERLFAQRLAADSTDLTALRRIATLRAWNARYDESIALFDRAVKLAPQDAELALERARVLAWARRYEPAIAAVDALLARDPANRAALEARAQFTSWSGRYSESLSDYSRLLEISPADPSLQIARARVLGWARQYEQAAGMYEGMLRNDPANREAQLGLAQVLSWGGRTDSAAVIFRKMVERNPRDVDAWKGLARAASWSGDLRRGEEHWRRVIEIAPDDAEGWVGLGATMRWQGRDAAALEALRKALAIDPNNTEARQQLAYAEAAVAPRASPSYVYEADSDRNRMQTFNATGTARVARNLEARAQGYIRDLTGIDLSGTEREVTTNGGTFGLTLHTNQGWTASGAAGVTGNGDVAESSTSARLSVTTPRWLPIAGTLTYNRAAFDYTAALAARGVRTDQLAADATARLGARSQLIGNIAATRYTGNEKNEQLSGGVAITHRFLRWLTAGIATRAFSFEKDRSELLEGYFNPDFYGLAELTAATYHELGPWVITTETAPGYQQIGSQGDRSGSFRTTGRLSYTIAPGRQLGVSGAYANSGLQQLSPTGASEYDYRAFSVFGSWTF